jgi:hypothetical protein
MPRLADNIWVTSSDHSDISPLRASDADRDRAAAAVATALAEGRLAPEEHAERLDLIYAARTLADLAALVRDLPASSGGQHRVTAGAAAGQGRRWIMAIFGGARRKGIWTVSP